MSDQRNDYRNDGHLRDCDDCAYVVTYAEAEGRMRGWNKALYAAQEAIRNREDGDYFPWVQVEIAVAAIEALKTK